MTVDEEQRSYVEIIAKLGVRNLPPGGAGTLEAMVRLVPGEARFIVDLGCNTGCVAARIANEFPNATVVGIDVSPAMIESAHRRLARESLKFRELDVESMGRTFNNVDAAVCAGSAAFFPDRRAALESIEASLAPNGVLIDAHYVYDPDVPLRLQRLERSAFGIQSAPRSAAECLEPYERAGLPVRSYERLDRWYLSDKPEAEVYRSILASLPGIAELVDGMVDRRKLINRLAPYRHPVIVTASRSDTGSEPRSHDVATALAVMELFRAREPQPLSRLRSMLPYEFLAYVGDPDAAPGGAAAVRQAASRLNELGLDEAAAVLDVGCFTGMSTLALARSFPRVVGIDLDQEFLRVAQAVGETVRSPAEFRCMDGGATAFGAASQDAYIMTATLGYTPQPRELLDEAMRILRPGGLLVEYLYHYPVVDRVVEDRVRRAVGPDVRIASFSSQVGEVEDAGFRLVRAERISRTSPRPEFLETLCAAVVALERERNDHLTERELDDFGQLFREYVGRVQLGDAAPLVYMCIYVKPDGRVSQFADTRP